MKRIISILLIIIFLSTTAAAIETIWRHSGFEVAGYDINFTWHNITKIYEINNVNFTDSLNGPYSYLIYTDGTNYYAKNGSTGKVDYSGTVFVIVIQSAIDTLAPPGGTIYIAVGKYYVDNKTINIPLYNNRSVSIFGSGMFATSIIKTITSTGDVFHIQATGYPTTIKDLAIYADTGGNFNVNGVYLNHSNGILLNNLWFNGFNYGLYINSSTDILGTNIISELSNQNYYINNSAGVELTNIISYDPNDCGMYILNHPPTEKGKITIINSEFIETPINDICLVNTSNVTMVGNTFTSNISYGGTNIGTTLIANKGQMDLFGNTIGSLFPMKVVIGSTDSTTTSTLDVTGTIRASHELGSDLAYFGQKTTTNPKLLYLYNNPTNNFIGFQGVESNVAYNQNIILQSIGGNVGIGTTSPSSKLVVVGNTNISTGNLSVTTTGKGIVFPDNSFQTSAPNVNLTIPTTKPASPVNGSMFGNTTSHALNWYDNGVWYLPNGTAV